MASQFQGAIRTNSTMVGEAGGVMTLNIVQGYAMEMQMLYLAAPSDNTNMEIVRAVAPLVTRRHLS